MSLVIWLLIYTGLRALIGLTATRFSAALLSKLVFFPGVLAAILVRAFTAGISQARIEELNPPWTPGPPVRYGGPKVPLVGAFFFGTLPPIAAALLPLYAAMLFGFTPGFDVTLHAMSPDAESFSLFWKSAEEILYATIATTKTVDWYDPRIWCIVYLSVAFEIYLAPPLIEWGPTAIMLAGVACVLGSVEWLGLEPAFLSRAWFIKAFYGDPVWDSMARLVAHALFVLALSLLFAGASHMLSARAERKKRG